MTFNTINTDNTITGGEGALLANRYRIVRQLGQGGMGSVWLVEDTQLDDKPFAVKMLPSILVSNKRAYRQLKDEALVAMRLVHPNIVQIRAFEENDGNPFLVMDYVDGQTLDDYLGEHTGTTGVSPVAHGSTGTTGVSPVAVGLSEAEVLRILRPIAAALDYAHGEGVVHRDVKPANVMIRKDGHPYILDFGIAREIQETMTRVTGKLSSGTLLYMSPEQLMGDQPKPAQDVYSFAAMVYECLKGEPPFVRGAIEDQIKNKQPEPPPGGTQLVASVMSGLAKRPDDRPSSCAAVLEGKDLGRAERVERVDFVRRGTSDTLQPGRARSPSAPPEPQSGRAVAPQPPQGGSRSRATAAILTVAALALVIAGGWWWMAGREKASRASATIRTSGTTEMVSAVPPDATNVPAAKRMPHKPGPTDADVVAIAVEASVQKECLAGIDGADGFKEKKEEISSLLTRATSYGKARRYKESAQAFSNYVAKCQELVQLDNERKLALKDKTKAQEAFQMAEAADAKTHAISNWNTAVGVWRQATDQFDQMEFSQACRTFSSAAEHFRKCADEVKKARENEAATRIQMAENFLKSFQKSVEEIAAAEAELERANQHLSRLQAADQRGVLQEAVEMADARVKRAKQTVAQARAAIANQAEPKNLAFPLRGQIEETCRAYGKACLEIERMREIYTEINPKIVDKNAEIHTMLSNMKDQVAQALLSLKTIRQSPNALTALERDIFTFEFFKESLSPYLQQGLESHYEAYCKNRTDAALAGFKKALRAYKEAEAKARAEVEAKATAAAVAKIKTQREQVAREKGSEIAETVAKARVEERSRGWAQTRRDCERIIVGHKGVQLWEGGPYWAETNIGADKPWEYGYYFWWGDTVGYKRENDSWVASDGSSSEFSFAEGNTPTFGKDNSALKREGWITTENVLAPQHDAAQVQWGGGWRMPTIQELVDLTLKCNWSWTTMNGVNGYVIRGRGDYASASIFLPAAGCGYGTSLYDAGSYGYYWSSVPSSGNDDAWSLYFYSSGHDTHTYSSGYGRSVRPVQGFTK